MAFVTLENATAISERVGNYAWCKLADKKICVIMQTISTSANFGKIFAQIVTFGDDGSITKQTPIFVRTLPVHVETSFLDAVAISETRICLSFPHQSISAISDLNATNNLAAGRAPTDWSLLFFDLATGTVETVIENPFVRSDLVPNSTSTLRHMMPTLMVDGSDIVVIPSIAMITGGAGGATQYIKVPSVLRVNTTTYVQQMVDSGYSPATQNLGVNLGNSIKIRGHLNTYVKNGRVVQRAGHFSIAAGLSGNKSASFIYHPNTKKWTFFTDAPLVYTLPLEDKCLAFIKPTASAPTNMRFLDYDGNVLASVAVGSALDLSNTIDAELLPDGTLICLGLANNGHAESTSYAAAGNVESQELAATNTYNTTVLKLNVFKVYPEFNFASAPPQEIELQLPYGTGRVVRTEFNYARRVIFPITDKVFALIGGIGPLGSSQSSGSAAPLSIATLTV